MEIEKYSSYLVTKANKLTEESMHRLDMQEQRLIAFLTAQIHPDDEDFKDYIFNVKEFAELLDLPKERYYSEMKRVTRKLISKVVSIPEPDGLLQMSWLSSAKYFKKKGYVRLRFDPALKPYLLQLKECFTSYKLGNVLKLRSKYAFRFYEMMKKNELLGEVKYSIKYLRERFMLADNELKQWNDFKRKVIEIAIKEINKKTDLLIKYKPIKEFSRAYTHIIFYIKKKDNIEQVEEVKKENYYKLLSLIKDEKDRNKKTIQSAIVKYLKKEGYDYVERNILYANEKAEKNYRNFLIKSLKEDWAVSWIEDLEDEKEKTKELQEKQKRIDEYNKRLKKTKEKIRERAIVKIESWSEEEYKRICEETKKEVGGIIQDDEIIRENIIFKEMQKILNKAVEIGKLRPEVAEEILRI